MLKPSFFSSSLCTLACLLALAAPASAISTTVKVPLREGRLHTSDLSADLLKRLCLRGDLLAEELSTTARELVVAWLHREGVPDREVASRTGMSTYTAARIRARLSLPAHHFRP